MTFSLRNFIRNEMAFGYYKNCLEKGITDANQASHPNLYELGKELNTPYSKPERIMESQPKLSSSRKTIEQMADYDALLPMVIEETEKKGRATVEIKSSIMPTPDGEVDVKRIYLFKGKSYTENCRYPSKSEFENEVLDRAVSNLKSGVQPFSLDIQGNIAIIKKAS